MATADSSPMVIEVDAVTRVSGLWMVPPDATACFIVAHGAGAGMRHPFMENLAGDLAALRIATLRYQFPYMERGSRRTDPPARCRATVRAAVAAAGARLPSLPLFAGGKSFGGRMTSQAQAAAPLPQVRGLIFLGFPLHPPKAPSVERGGHLFDVRIPMLFVQGARDEFAELPLLNALLQRLGGGSTLCLLPQADHSFKVPARATVSRAKVHDDMLAALTAWIGALA